uniref:Uncharacterized protein n=1 Tax=Rhizophora mucronata TaxID=61149 RepID=A0A2P2Q0P6_RHIMU
MRKNIFFYVPLTASS